MDPKLAEVLSKYEPPLRAAIEAMLAKVKSSASVAQIEAYIMQGDLSGLVGYVQKLYAAAAPEMIAVLSAIVAAAGTAAEADIRAAAAKVARENRRLAAAGLRLMPIPIGSPQMPASAAGITFYGEGKTPDSPGYRFNPINPKTIAATRTWQGNLIQQMTQTDREGIMAQVREGLLAGENPRTTARKIRVGLDLTTSQKGHVENFGATIDEIVAGAKNIDASWGLYTPEMIERMRKDNPVKFRQMNFTPGEIKGGRQWAKISRASGGVGGQGPIGFQGGGDQMPKTFTTQYMDATGQIRTRTHSFVQTGESAFRVDAKGNPLDGITSFRLRDKRLDPYLYEVMAAKTPEAKAFAQKQLDAVAGQMKKRYHERYTKHRSMVIARTEALRAANLGSYEAWRQALEDNSLFEPGQIKRRWVTAKDDRVRPDHRGAAGQVRGFNEPFMVGGQGVMFPPHQPNCLPGYSLVAPIGGVLAVFIRQYDGEMVVIETEGGRKLTITPNHPALTSRGWVKAKGVEVGDHLMAVKCGPVGQHDTPESHIQAQDIGNLAREVVKFRPGKSTTFDFHGDAVHGHVTEVLQDADLMMNLTTALGEGFAQFDLPPADVMVKQALGRLNQGAGSHPVEPILLSGAGSVSGTDLLRALVISHAGPLDDFLFGSRPQADTAIGQKTSDRPSADPVQMRQKIDTFASKVERDKVVRVSRFPFSGHVYNFQTGSNTYIADGIIVHNCRCTISYVVDLTAGLTPP